MDERLTPEQGLEKIKASESGRYGVLLERGTLELGYYKPEKVDPQQPHDRDEVYIVQSGSGYFVTGDTRCAFRAGDALFVPAGRVHRFEDFSNDFQAWVIFYGPPGGEVTER